MQAIVLLALVTVATTTCPAPTDVDMFILTRDQTNGITTTFNGIAENTVNPFPFNATYVDDIIITISTIAHSTGIEVSLSSGASNAHTFTFTPGLTKRRESQMYYINTSKILSIHTTSAARLTRLFVFNNGAAVYPLVNTNCSNSVHLFNVWHAGDIIQLVQNSTLTFNETNIEMFTLGLSNDWYGTISLTLPLIPIIINNFGSDICIHPSNNNIIVILDCISSNIECEIRGQVYTLMQADAPETVTPEIDTTLLTFNPLGILKDIAVDTIQLTIGPIDGSSIPISIYTPSEGITQRTITLPTPCITTNATILIYSITSSYTATMNTFNIYDGIENVIPTVNIDCSSSNIGTDFTTFIGDQTNPFSLGPFFIQLNPLTLSAITVVLNKTTTAFALGIILPDAPAAAPAATSHTHIPIIGATVGSVTGFIVILATIIAAVKVTKAKHRAYSLVVNSN